MTLVEVTVLGVGVDPANNAPLVVLRESAGERALPIWIGPAEAMAISMALEGLSSERPLTHDLIASLLGGLQVATERIVITQLVNNTFYARIFLRTGQQHLSIDARPSDSIAIALRVRAPIFVAENVMRGQASIKADPESSDQDLAERLRKLRPEDFGKYPL